VMPLGPTTSNVVLATALPNWTDMIDTSTSAGAGTRSVGDRCAGCLFTGRA
jgi:hypothetical protein